ncbi:frizzled-5-like [Haliotis cracherodii]|uniref:frizzled-5-like n=1 Tax=Haliotis cracherodii TaxID=6455 RepID=UPI0039E77942
MYGLTSGLAVVFILYPVMAKGRSNHEGMCSAPITLPPICADMPYNTTKFPNFLNHRNLDDAAIEANQFYPLIKTQCSSSLKFLVCSTYFPYCSPLVGTMPTCRHICENSKRDCESLMNSFGFTWPSPLNCDKFPDKKDSVCLDMEPTTIKPTTTTTTMKTTVKLRTPKRKRLPNHKGMCSSPTTLPHLCSDMPYNTTSFPNFLNHRNLEDAALEAHQFHPLIKVQCSSSFKFLVCSTYFPYCSPLVGTMPTCRHICEDSKRDCESLMNKFGFTWPTSLNCDKFPDKKDGSLCLDMEPTTVTPAQTTAMEATVKPPERKRLRYRRLLVLLRKTAGDIRDSMQFLYSALSP